MLNYRHTLLIVVFAAANWAAQDDLDDNQDLRPTLEEAARSAVLRRWPDATEIDVFDAAADDGDGVEPENDAPAPAPRKDEDQAPQPLAPAEAADPEPLQADPDADAGWTLSVIFTAHDKQLEALMDDEGTIYYVYEPVALEDAPKAVLAAARVAAQDTEVLYIDKLLDETEHPPRVSYIVGFADCEVDLAEDGQLTGLIDFSEPGHLEQDQPDEEHPPEVEEQPDEPERNEQDEKIDPDKPLL